MRKPTIKRLPWAINSANPTETARFLIEHAGGVGAAHDCVTRAAKLIVKARGRPSYNDTMWLLIAAAIKKRDLCTRRKALLQVAQMAADGDDAVAAMVRRLESKLKRTTLETFARNQPLEAKLKDKNNFAFSLRD